MRLVGTTWPKLDQIKESEGAVIPGARPSKLKRVTLHSQSLLERATTVGVIAVAILVSSIWLLRMPLFQNIDEQGHADYAYEIFDAARLFTVEHPRFSDSTSREVRFLEKSVNFFPLHRIPAARVPPNYGTSTYFRAIDKIAPKPSDTAPKAGSLVSHYAENYPAGYYGIAAIAMKLAYMLTQGSLVATIFAARSVGIYALITGLFCYAASLRMLGIPFVNRALAFTAIAVMPLLDWVSAYVQPDSLVFATAALSFLAYLKWKARADTGSTLVLVLALAATPLVKVHYGAIVDFAILSAMFAEAWLHTSNARTRLHQAGIACFIVIGALYSGSRLSIVHNVAAPKHYAPFTNEPSAASNAWLFIKYALDDFRRLYFGGEAFSSFWNRFGDLPAHYIDPASPVGSITQVFIAILSVATLVAVLIRQLTAWKRLARVSRRRLTKALALLLCDPILNCYILWTAFLVGVEAITDGGIFTEGRYFVPMLLPTVLLAIKYAPDVLPKARRATAGTAMACCWLIYSIVTCPIALLAMQNRYYEPPDTTANPTFAQIDKITVGISEPVSTRNLELTAHEPVRISGILGSIEDGANLYSFARGGPLQAVPIILGPRHSFHGVKNSHRFTLRLDRGVPSGNYEIQVIVKTHRGEFADDWVYVRVSKKLGDIRNSLQFADSTRQPPRTDS